MSAPFSSVLLTAPKGPCRGVTDPTHKIFSTKSTTYKDHSPCTPTPPTQTEHSERKTNVNRSSTKRQSNQRPVILRSLHRGRQGKILHQRHLMGPLLPAQPRRSRRVRATPPGCSADGPHVNTPTIRATHVAITTQAHEWPCDPQSAELFRRRTQGSRSSYRITAGGLRRFRWF